MGVTDAVEILVFLDLAITASAVIWLPKQPEEAEGDLFAKGQSGNAAGPDRRFHEPGHMAAEPLLCQIR
jgi:hypothetical protein